MSVNNNRFDTFISVNFCVLQVEERSSRHKSTRNPRSAGPGAGFVDEPGEVSDGTGGTLGVGTCANQIITTSQHHHVTMLFGYHLVGFLTIFLGEAHNSLCHQFSKHRRNCLLVFCAEVANQLRMSLDVVGSFSEVGDKVEDVYLFHFTRFSWGLYGINGVRVTFCCGRYSLRRHFTGFTRDALIACEATVIHAIANAIAPETTKYVMLNGILKANFASQMSRR